MPIPAVAMLAIQAKAGQQQSNRTNLLNLGYNEWQNYQSRKFSREMYDKQYADNVRFWQMQNDYNSPQNQMKRFQEAGLNPNLIYGQGNSGPAGAIQTPDVQTPQFKSIEVQGAPAPRITEMYDLEMKQAQIDNLKAQNTVILEDALLRKAQTRSTLKEAERKVFDLEYAKENRDTSLQAQKERLRQMKTQTDIALDENIRRAALTAKSLQEAAERLKQYPLTRAETRARIDNLIKDGTIKRVQIDMWEDGINPNDPMWARILALKLEELLQGAADIKKEWENSSWRKTYRKFNPKY